MKIIKSLGLMVCFAGLSAGAIAQDEEEEAQVYTYATYFDEAVLERTDSFLDELGLMPDY